MLRPWAAERLLGIAPPTGTHLALLRPDLADHFTHTVRFITANVANRHMKGSRLLSWHACRASSPPPP